MAAAPQWVEAAPARPAADTQALAKRVREPAVAGLFYPKDRDTLSKMLDEFLAAAKAEEVPGLKALICPHAGYVYSGPTAAHGYRLVRGQSFSSVMVLAPSHYAAFTGAAVSAADVFRTPLGDVEVSTRAKELAKVSPLRLESPCPLERPSWASVSSRKSPPEGEDTPDTWEHADEVQIPFLQKTLPKFQVIPIIFGQVDPRQAAAALLDKVDDHTLIVASSDLSHYHPYAEAKQLDARCIKAICDLDLEQMRSQEACGKGPILALMEIARQKGWKARLLDYRNSGDTAGDRTRVVGYAAIAFYTPGSDGFTAANRRVLLEMARKTLTELVSKDQTYSPETNGLPARLLEPRGCFVTLTKRGQLRGCIGNILPREPLCRAIADNARSAAIRDPRFRPVRSDELGQIEIEISVLTEPKPLTFSSPTDLLSRLTPDRDGVVLQIGRRSATYLPQVWAQIPDKVDFLNSLSEKAGCEASAWRGPGVQVSTYQVEAFKESE